MTYASPTSINTSKGIMEILTYTNNVTDNWISNLLLMAIWIITLVGFYRVQDDFKGALAVAGYGTFVVGLLFWIGGFVSAWAFGISLALAILGTIVLLLDNN